MNASVRLERAKHDDWSQHGEDGILAALFEAMGLEKGFFCEFGAWDGEFLSNTRALLERGWSGLLIEGDPNRFQQLRERMREKPVECVRAFLAPSGPHSLDAVLSASASWPHIRDRGLDLLSIDIDSDDLAIWRSLSVVRPRVVIIEYNFTIPLEVRYENPSGRARGNSARAIVEYAESIGYVLVANTLSNLIFVAEEAHRAGLPRLQWWEVDTSEATRFFFGYDGTLIRVDRGESSDKEFFQIPWQAALLPQPITRSLRRFSPSTPVTLVQVGLNVLQIMITRPLAGLRLLAGGRARLGHLLDVLRTK